MKLSFSLSTLNPAMPLRKHSASIHVDADFSLVDHKILNVLYKCAYDHDRCRSDYYILKISDVASYIGWKKSVKRDILESLKKLSTSGIHWNIFQQDNRNRSEWTAAGRTGFIASYSYNSSSGTITFSLSPEIKRVIAEPNIYACIDLQAQRKIKSKYDLIFYEYFIEELSRNRAPEVITRWYSINDIRRLLHLSDSQYKEFRTFNHHCIKNPINSLNRSNLGIKIELLDTAKVGRKIVAVRFKISRTESNDAPQEMPILEKEDLLKVNQYDIVAELSQIFGNKQAAIDLVGDVKRKFPDYDLDEYLRTNIEFAKRKKNASQVSNFVGFLKAAIRNDYAKYKTILELHQKKIKMKLAEEEQHRKKLEKETDEEKEFSKVLEEFRALPINFQEAIYSLCRSSSCIFKILSDEHKFLHAAKFYSMRKPELNLRAQHSSVNQENLFRIAA